MPNIRGFDVSHFQGDISPAGWLAALNAGYRFVFVKATEGLGFVDRYAEQNAHRAKDAGFAVGMYHFGTATDDGSAQAEHFLSTTESYRDILGGDVDGVRICPATFDLEQQPSGRDWPSLDLGTRVLRVSNFLREVDGELNERTQIYCSPGWFNSTFPGVDFSGHPLWVAQYGVPAPRNCGAWKEHRVWQFDEYGSVPGIGERSVDLDVISVT